jgi:hypothetical protein
VSSVEVFLAISVKNWRTIHFQSEKAVGVGSCVLLLFIVINTNVFFTHGYAETVNGTTIWFCYGKLTPRWQETYAMIHFFLYSVAPFLVILASHVIIFVKLNMRRILRLASNSNRVSYALDDLPPHQSHPDSTRAHQIAMVKTMVCTTLLFVCMAMPSALVSLYFYELKQTEAGIICMNFFDAVSFTFNSFNLVVYATINRKFSQHFKQLLESVHDQCTKISFPFRRRHAEVQ